MTLVARKLDFLACEQKGADQDAHLRLCYPFPGKHIHVNLLNANFNILHSLCSLADWFVHYLDANHEDRFSRDDCGINVRMYKVPILLERTLLQYYLNISKFYISK